jgi:hypothetical protein
MTNAAEIAARYIEAWNETDPVRCRALVAAFWTADASYMDPMIRGDGPDQIAALVGAVHERFPDHRFALTGTHDGHHGRVRFSWTLGVAGAPPVVRGTDFAVLAEDGRLRGVTGFLDVKLSRFGRAVQVFNWRLHDAQDTPALSAPVPSPDGRVGPRRSRSG